MILLLQSVPETIHPSDILPRLEHGVCRWDHLPLLEVFPLADPVGVCVEVGHAALRGRRCLGVTSRLLLVLRTSRDLQNAHLSIKDAAVVGFDA